MEKENILNVLNDTDSFCYEFSQLCDKSKNLIFHYIKQKGEASVIETFETYGVLQFKLTPIEQIFHIAFYLYCLNFYKINGDYDYSSELGIPIHAFFMEEIFPQKKIKYLNKTYVIDFEFDLSRLRLDGNPVYPKLTHLKYAVELDGFDYHSKKDQMNKDYERENNLKLQGYNVIRFTGSQVFNNPYTCIDTLISLILKDIQICFLEDKYGK